MRVARGTVHGIAVELIKPLTYMNRSGSVLALRRADPEFDPARDLLVLVDEAALPTGRFRLRAKGSAGGHNGLRSIEGALRSQQYPRLRIGVGPLPPEYDDMADFVLDRFEPAEAEAIDALLEPMAEAVECWLTDGIDAAMNRYNRTDRRTDGPTDSRVDEPPDGGADPATPKHP